MPEITLTVFKSYDQRTGRGVFMLIAQVEPPQEKGGGDYYYRTYAPSVTLAQQEGVYVVNLTNVHRLRWEVFCEADVLVLKNICDPDFLPLIERRKAEKKITIYEMADDLAAIQPWNPVYFFFKNPENLALVFRVASVCDAIQFSVPRLDTLYGHLNRHRRVFPNQLLEVPTERSFPSNSDVVVGWGGSHGHLEDVAQIAPTLIQWVMHQPNVSLHVMCSDPIWSLFRDLPQDKKKWTPPGSLADYYAFLGKIDIGIAPLKDTAFNQSRSDVKFLEYAAFGVVAVMADLTPYKRTVEDGHTGFFYKSSQHLVAILERLIKDRGTRRNVTAASRRYLLGERLQENHCLERLDFYTDLLQSSGRRCETEVSMSPFTRWSRSECAVANGRYLQLEDSLFERLLLTGLASLAENADPQKAGECFVEASRLDSRNYLPYLFGASVSRDPVETLMRALQCQPVSLKSWILLGEAFSRQGKIHQALESYSTAMNLFPEYEIPYLRVGVLLEKIGKKAEAIPFLNKATALSMDLANPFNRSEASPSRGECPANSSA